MKHKYSLVHLTNITCPPPALIRAAAKAGYDAVSIRTIPLGLPNERPYDMAHNPDLHRETKRALEETGISYTDTEIARIAEGVDVSSYEAALETAADMGVKHILTNIWDTDKNRYTEQFGRLCDIAGGYGLDVNVEFVTWASVGNLKQTVELLRAVRKENAGIVVDMLHFYRSRVTVSELTGLPKDWFKYVHLCDCEKEIPNDVNRLASDARSRRLIPGEGTIPIKTILESIPTSDLTYGLEIPNTERMNTEGFENYARRILKQTKQYLGE